MSFGEISFDNGDKSLFNEYAVFNPNNGLILKTILFSECLLFDILYSFLVNDKFFQIIRACDRL